MPLLDGLLGGPGDSGTARKPDGDEGTSSALSAPSGSHSGQHDFAKSSIRLNSRWVPRPHLHLLRIRMERAASRLI